MDKRKFIRLEILLEVVHRREVHSSVATLTLTKNISQGGVCFVDCREIDNFSVMDLMNLNIFFPFDSIPVKIKGKVSWIKNYDKIDEDGRNRFDMGVEFLEVRDEDKQRIEQYIKGKLKDKACT